MGKGTFIVRYNTKKRTRDVILVDGGEKKLFPYNSGTKIANIHKYGDLLIFHDRNRTDPFKINLRKVYTSYYETREDVMLIKAQPDMPVVSVGYDPQYSSPTFNNNVFWFALRYRYEDGEVSAISPYSGPRLTIDGTDHEDADHVVLLNFDSEGLNRFDIGEFPLNRDVPVVLKSLPISYDSTETVTSVCQAFSDPKIYATTKYRLISYYPGNYSEPSVETTTSKLGINVFKGIGIDSTGSVRILAGGKENYIYIFKYKNHKWLNVASIRSAYGYGEFVQGKVVMSAFGNYVYVSGAYEMYRSKRNGEVDTWEKVFDIRSKLSDYKSSVIGDVCCSSDGKIVYITGSAVDSNNRNRFLFYKSENYGTDFSLLDNSDQGGVGVSCSATGGVVVAGNRISTDYGKTFELTSFGATYQGDVSVSFSGRYIVSGNSDWNTTEGNGLYISENYGEKFTPLYINNGNPPVLSYFRFSYPTHPYIGSSIFFINDKSNFVDIRYKTGNKHVRYIDILMKKGASMYVIHTVDKGKWGTGSNREDTYRFLNTELYKVVATKDVLKLFDNVPFSAATSCIVQNALMFGNYYEGFDTSIIYSELSVEILRREFSDGDISLKCGTKQRYGIIYYDYFGRCTPPLRVKDVYIDNIRKEPGKERRTAFITIKGEAPSWAVKYKIARGTPNISFDTVVGFDNVYAVDDKIYLEITSYPWIVPKSGDYIELLSESKSEGNGSMVVPIFDFYDNSGESSVTITLSDGTHVAQSQTKNSSPVPPGRYIIVNPPDREGYRYDNVLTGDSKYIGSSFYVVYENTTIGDVFFNEIPYEFRIENGLHKGNQKDQDSKDDDAECLLEYDGDVVLMSGPIRELNRYPNRQTFTTLGRTVGKVENYGKVHRFAGLCVSEPYVEDTGYNGFSSFNQSLINYKDLEKNHRDIEKIDGFDTNVEVYQRDKVSVVQYRKNVLTTASGDKQITQSQDLFGEQQMYAADYGMDNFRSYAKSGNSRYFVDSSRGVVLRKDVNGVFPISRYGMNGYLIKALMEKGSLWGVYDGKHDSYVLCLPERAVNFFERLNGWSSFFEMVPDGICSTNSGVYSFKAGVLYEHDRTERLSIYGKNGDVMVEFVCNELPDVMKVFNAIKLESNFVAYKTEFFTHNGYSVIDGSFYEHKEGVYLSYVPMGGGEESAEYVMAGICRVSYSGIRIPLVNQEKVLVHTGDAVYVMKFKDTQPEGDKVHVGYVSEIGDGYIDLDRTAQIQAGSLVICADTSQVNGSLHRDRYIRVRMYFSTGEHMLEMKSVQVDIDESKI